MLKSNKNQKKELLNIFEKNLNNNIITYKSKRVSYRMLLSYIIQINIVLKKQKLDKKIIITQFDNRFLTLLFYLGAIFSKSSICPLDPNLPAYRLNKIKNSLKVYKVIKR